MKFNNMAITFVVCIGFLQILGLSIPGLKVLRGIGTMTVASPLPLVFSHFRGLETFSSNFTLRITELDGNTKVIPLTPQTYNELGGPYNRRNVYGAVVAYGPKFDTEIEKNLMQNVLNYGFCNKGPLSKIIDTKSFSKVEIIVTNEITPMLTTLDVTCN